MEIFLHKGDLPSDFKVIHDLAIDTEAMGLNYNNRDRLCLVQVSTGDGNAHLVKFSKDEFNAPNLVKILEDSKITKIFHFARYDVGILKKHLNVDIKSIYCTKIASRLVRTYTDSHGLKELCRELLGVNVSKEQQTTDWGREVLSTEQLAYAANDVLYLHRLRDKLNDLLLREDRMGLAKKCFEFLPTRVDLDIMGWPEFDIFQH